MEIVLLILGLLLAFALATNEQTKLRKIKNEKANSKSNETPFDSDTFKS